MEFFMAMPVTRLEKLKELERILYDGLQVCDSDKIAALSRQYRETLREIDEIEGAESNDDDIAEILTEREAAGKAGAVR